MTLNRYAKRTDAVQAEFIQLCRAHGVWVEVVHQPLDTLLTYRRFQWLCEVKSHGGRLTRIQQDYINRCKAEGVFYWVWTEGDAISPMLDAAVKFDSAESKPRPLKAPRSQRR